jgi:hypothetical protein
MTSLLPCFKKKKTRAIEQFSSRIHHRWFIIFLREGCIDGNTTLNKVTQYKLNATRFTTQPAPAKEENYIVFCLGNNGANV